MFSTDSGAYFGIFLLEFFILHAGVCGEKISPKFGEAKYMVRLFHIRREWSMQTFLGIGAIISERHVVVSDLTLYDKEPDKIVVVSGFPLDEEGKAHAVARFILRPNKVTQWPGADIALILLQKSLSSELSSGSLQQLYLPYFEVPIGESMILLSSRYTDESEQIEEEYMSVNSLNCEFPHWDYPRVEDFPNLYFCAKCESKSDRFSRGNIGSPLVKDGYIIGIRPFTSSDYSRNVVFLNISHHSYWIFTEISRLYTSPKLALGQTSLNSLTQFHEFS